MQKKILRRLFWLTVIFYLVLQMRIASNAYSSEKLPIQIFSNVDRNVVTIGDKIKYTITVITTRDVEVKLPEFVKELGGLEVRDFGTSKKTLFGKKTYKQWYLLSTYVSGRYTIPRDSIKYRIKGKEKWQEVFTEEIYVDVESILKDTENVKDIKDIAGPVALGGVTLWYIVLIFVVMFLCGAFFIYFYKHKPPKESFVPQRPAYEIAYEALEMLKGKEYLKQKNFKMYYIELSDIVRKYLENRFNLRAPEMTTEEFLYALRDEDKLTYEQKALLRDFLSHCDLVKFAKYKPAENEANLSFESAKRLIDQTKELPEGDNDKKNKL